MWCTKRHRSLPSRISITYEETTHIDEVYTPKDAPSASTKLSPQQYQRGRLRRRRRRIPSMPSTLPPATVHPPKASPITRSPIISPTFPSRSDYSPSPTRKPTTPIFKSTPSTPTISERTVREHKQRIMKDFTTATPKSQQPISPMASRTPAPTASTKRKLRLGFQRTIPPTVPNKPFMPYLKPKKNIGSIPGSLTGSPVVQHVVSHEHKICSKCKGWYPPSARDCSRLSPPERTSLCPANHLGRINCKKRPLSCIHHRFQPYHHSCNALQPSSFPPHHQHEHKRNYQHDHHKVQQPIFPNLRNPVSSESMQLVNSPVEIQYCDEKTQSSPKILKRLISDREDEHGHEDVEHECKPNSNVIPTIIKAADEPIKCTGIRSAKPTLGKKKRRRMTRKMKQRKNRQITKEQIKKQTQTRGFFNWFMSKFRQKSSKSVHTSRSPSSHMKIKPPGQNKDFPSTSGNDVQLADPIINNHRPVDKSMTGLIPQMILNKMSIKGLSSYQSKPNINMRGTKTEGKRAKQWKSRDAGKNVTLPVLKTTRAQLFRNEFIKKKLLTTGNPNLSDSWWKNFNTKLLPLVKLDF